MAQYSLTVINESEFAQGSPDIAMFAVLPEAEQGHALSTVWRHHVIHPGNRHTFCWDIEWGFAWSAQGTEKGKPWSGGGTSAADPTSPAKCAVRFDYKHDAFLFEEMTQDPAPDHDMLYIENTGAVPIPSVQNSSVGVTLNGTPVCVTNGGPNLVEFFTLHPVYYVAAGNYKHTQMVDVTTLTQALTLDYSAGTKALTVTLDAENNWHLRPGKPEDLAAPCAP
ncbi:hypothetical protein GCM10022254_38930 [Actinomadura meridiana]|uniref:Uncharacterized protein n=1 Tax=Actinomadura meridiana TaxID=559626 RepID=A0ABP8C6B7_9ACTN